MTEEVSHAERLHTRKNYNMDLAIKDMGGFGRLQKLSLCTLALARTSGVFLFYTFPLLTAA